MKTKIVTVYKQEDFDSLKNNMTAEKAIRILEGLPRGWFPYKMPSWANDVTDYDYEMYEICCAIWFAMDKLKDGE